MWSIYRGAFELIKRTQSIPIHDPLLSLLEPLFINNVYMNSKSAFFTALATYESTYFKALWSEAEDKSELSHKELDTSHLSLPKMANLLKSTSHRVMIWKHLYCKPKKWPCTTFCPTKTGIMCPKGGSIFPLSLRQGWHIVPWPWYYMNHVNLWIFYKMATDMNTGMKTCIVFMPHVH